MKVGDAVTAGGKQGIIKEIADNQRNGQQWKSCFVSFTDGKPRWFRMDDLREPQFLLEHIPITKRVTAVVVGENGPTVFCSEPGADVDKFTDAISRMWLSHQAA